MIRKSGKKILVTGATGNQGSFVADKLMAEGWTLRALTRDPSDAKAKELSAKGVEVVKGDYNDRASLDAALGGVCGAFAVFTPFEQGIEAEIRHGVNFADAAKAAGIRHLVYSSVIAANTNTGIPHFDSKNEIEKHIKSIGLPCTVLRPAFFMYNFESDFYKNAILNGSLPIAIKPYKVHQMLAPEDMAFFVALAFDNPKDYIGKELDLASDEMTMPEAANCFSRVIGRPVQYKEVPVEQISKHNEDMGRMFEWFNRTNFSVDIRALKRLHPEMMTLEWYLRKHGWAETATRFGRKAA
jgi:uncharacterized protein YbjT (DUF2867 family)